MKIPYAKEINEILESNIVGCDPGEVTFMTLAFFKKGFFNNKINTENYGEVESKSFSTNSYYHDTLSNDRSLNYQHFLDEFDMSAHTRGFSIKSIISCIPTKKVTSLSEFAELFKYFNDQMANFKTFAKASNSRKWRYKSFLKKRQVFTEMYQKYFKGNIVAFGNYLRPSSCVIKFRRPPIKEFKMFLKRQGVKIFEVDEFLTSKLCHKCYHVLDNVKDGEIIHFGNDFYTKTIPYSKLKYCPKCKKEIDRDLNGAINIANKFVNYLNARPIERFERSYFNEARNNVLHLKEN